jgi:hypothetical protein
MRMCLLLAAFSLIPHLVAVPSLAEEQNTFASLGRLAAAVVLILGAITGFGSYGPVGYWRLCSPLAVGLHQWQVGYFERVLKLNEAQKSLLDGLSLASAEANKAIAASCDGDRIL